MLPSHVQASPCRILSLSSSTQPASSLLVASSQRDVEARVVFSRTLRASLSWHGTRQQPRTWHHVMLSVEL